MGNLADELWNEYLNDNFSTDLMSVPSDILSTNTPTKEMENK